MNLSKVFAFKGLFQSGRKMATPAGAFRRFTNSFKDKTGRIRPTGKTLKGGNDPYFPQGEDETLPEYITDVDWGAPFCSQIFKNNIFQMIPGISTQLFGTFRYGQDTESIPFAESQNGLGVDAILRGKVFNYNDHALAPQGNYSSAVVNNKLYICQYVDPKDFDDATVAALPSNTLKVVQSSLYRFDGLRIAKAGLPTPYNHCAVTSGGTHRARIVYMTIGLDAEPVFSDYLEYNFTPTSNLISFNLGYYNPTTFAWVTDPVGTSGVHYPTTREPSNSFVANQFISPNYDTLSLIINASVVPTHANGVGITITTTYDQEQQMIGDWYMFLVQTHTTNNMWDAFYLRLTGYEGGVLNRPIFASKIKGFNGYTSTWEDIDLTVGAPTGMAMADFLNHLQNCLALSNTQMIVSVSANTGGTLAYQIAQILPVLPDYGFHTSALTVLPKIFTRPRFGFISSYMQDWYEHTITKVQFPPTVKGITSYSNLLIGYDDDVLYFSDTSYGGSTEMTSGIANAFPPGSEFGKIVAVCGAENFALVSRERKNYVISGELTTGNYNVQECDVAVGGAVNQRAVTNSFANQIVFMNKTGVYAVSQNGNITDLSKDIKDIITGEATDGNLFDPSVFKGRKPTFDGGIFKIILDEVRGFILILTGQRDTETVVSQSNILVYDTNDGSWYEWTTPAGCSSIEMVDGVLHFLCDGAIYIESESTPNQILTPSWITMGEPSLEKQVTQLKIFGEVADTSPIKIKQQNDWKPELVTDVEHIPSITYIHKQRLNSSKAQATSVSIESQDNGLFIEGIEIEMVGVQEGMKK